MPQLDFSTYPPQLVWLLITFGVLYFIMARVALPRIAMVIEERRNRIADDLDQAEELKAKSEEARQAYRDALNEARGRAHGIAQETRDRLNALTERQRAMAESSLAEKVNAAEIRIAEAKSAAMAELDTIATETAIMVIKELVGGRIARSKVEAAVKSVSGDR